jgi:hypothetical protein
MQAWTAYASLHGYACPHHHHHHHHLQIVYSTISARNFSPHLMHIKSHALSIITQTDLTMHACIGKYKRIEFHMMAHASMRACNVTESRQNRTDRHDRTEPELAMPMHGMAWHGMAWAWHGMRAIIVSDSEGGAQCPVHAHGKRCGHVWMHACMAHAHHVCGADIARMRMHACLFWLLCKIQLPTSPKP